MELRFAPLLPPVHLQVADASFTLYDDDGASYAYEKGEGVRLTTLRWNNKTKKLTASGDDKALVAKAAGLVEVAGR